MYTKLSVIKNYRKGAKKLSGKERERGDEESRKASLLPKERGREVLGVKRTTKKGYKNRTISVAVGPAGRCSWGKSKGQSHISAG